MNLQLEPGLLLLSGFWDFVFEPIIPLHFWACPRPCPGAFCRVPPFSCSPRSRVPAFLRLRIAASLRLRVPAFPRSRASAFPRSRVLGPIVLGPIVLGTYSFGSLIMCVFVTWNFQHFTPHSYWPLEAGPFLYCTIYIIQGGFATDRRAGSNVTREVSTQRKLRKVCGAPEKYCARPVLSLIFDTRKV